MEEDPKNIYKNNINKNVYNIGFNNNNQNMNLINLNNIRSYSQKKPFGGSNINYNSDNQLHKLCILKQLGYSFKTFREFFSKSMQI